MEIISNNKWRDFVYGNELPDKVKDDFDYMDNVDDGCFIKYQGQYHDLGDFIKTDDQDYMGALSHINWHGVKSLGFFESLVISISDCGSQYRIGRFIT